MNYSFLVDPDLILMADRVYTYAKSHMLLSGLKIETLDFDASPATTFSGNSRLGYKVCIEVHQSPFPKTVESFISDCMKHNFPVKLYIAIPEAGNESLDTSLVKRANDFGVGLIIVGKRIRLINDALELSLLISDVDLHAYPKKLRPELSQAIRTYQNGDPVKGVSNLCDVVEHAIRKIAKQSKGNGNGKIPLADTLDLENGSLANVIKKMIQHSVLNDVVLASCLGLTSVRNDTSHPPKEFKQRVKRHLRLKTNFNHTLNILTDLLIDANLKGYRP